MSTPDTAREQTARVDLLLIAEMVEPDSRVLDVGCSDGALLRLLSETRNVDGRGIELSQDGVNRCVAHGLSVVQGDADEDLVNYPDAAFDYVILSQTLQATQHPRKVLEQMLRIGRHAIVSFPNFGHWRMRLDLLLRGRMPVNENLPESWYETRNIHFCTIRDFVDLCREIDVSVDQRIALDAHGRRMALHDNLWLTNLLGEQAVFLLRR